MALPPAGPDRTCVVTGASSGIGVEIARELAHRGRGVTLVARRGELLKEVAASIAADHGVRAEAVAADLSDPDSRASIPAELTRRGLTADVLVNNAGFSTTGPVYKSDRTREVLLVRTD